MAPSAFSLKRIIQEPFGPYPDDQILNSTIRNGTVFNLKSVSMECAGSAIGLDESEFIIRPPASNRVTKHPVHFYGKLEIVSLDWLSDQGRRWLEMDLRQRDKEIHLEHAVSGLTLARLYGSVKNEGSRIMVWIQGEKNLQASFLLGDGDLSKSLILYSKKTLSDNRPEGNIPPRYIYNVISLDVGTYRRSRNFLARYRLWALIDAIVKTDPDATPVERRTITWLTENYLARFRKSEQSCRLIFDTSNDPEVDEKGNTSHPRYLRHIPKSEVIEHFAAQAEWLLAHQLASASAALRRLNIAEWMRFCIQVQRARKQALTEKRKWGLPYGMENVDDYDDNDLASRLVQFGETRDFWVKKIEGSRFGCEKKHRKLGNAAAIQDAEETFQNDQGPGRFTYDSDFSEASTPSASDTDSEDSVSGSVVKRIPWFCWTTPEVISGGLKWHCPGCEYSIDLLNLTNENTRHLPTSWITMLTERKWEQATENRVQQAMGTMISRHYTQHLQHHHIKLTYHKDSYVMKHS